MKKSIFCVIFLMATQGIAFAQKGEPMQLYVCAGNDLSCTAKVSSVAVFDNINTSAAVGSYPIYKAYTFSVQLENADQHCLEKSTEITIIPGVALGDLAAVNFNYPNAFTCIAKLVPNDPSNPNILGDGNCETGSPAVQNIFVTVGPNNPRQPLSACAD